MKTILNVGAMMVMVLVAPLSAGEEYMTNASRLRAVERRLEELINTNAAFAPTLESMMAHLQQLDSDLAASRKTTPDVTNMSRVEQHLEALESQVAALRTSLAGRESETLSLTRDLAAMRSSHAWLESQRAEVERNLTQVADQRLRLEKIEGNVDRLNALYGTRKRQADSQQSGLAATETRHRDQQARIAKLDSRIHTVELSLARRQGPTRQTPAPSRASHPAMKHAASMRTTREPS